MLMIFLGWTWSETSEHENRVLPFILLINEIQQKSNKSDFRLIGFNSFTKELKDGRQNRFAHLTAFFNLCILSIEKLG